MNLSARSTLMIACLLWVVTVLAVPAVAQEPPYPPMVLDGFVYINGVKADDNTVVEARIGGQTVASVRTTTLAGHKGRYGGLTVQATADDEVELFVGGVRANEGPVPYAYGTQMLNLTVGQPAPPNYTLNVIVVGSGQTNPPAGTSSYPAGSLVLVSAGPGPGWEFVGWVGNVDSPGEWATWTIMDGNKSITANFALPTATPTAGPSPTPTTGPSPTPRPPTPTVPGTPPTARPLPTNTPGPGTTVPTPTGTPTAGATVSGLAALTATRTPTAGPVAAAGLTPVPTTGAGPTVAGATAPPTAVAGPVGVTPTPGAVASGPTPIPVSTLQLDTPSPTAISASAPTLSAPGSPTPAPAAASPPAASGGGGWWWAGAIVVVLAAAIGLGVWVRKRSAGAR